MLLRTAAVGVGVLELVSPRRVVDFWMGVATAEDSDVEVRPWVYTAARVEGVALLVWGLRGCSRRTDGSDSDRGTDIEVES